MKKMILSVVALLGLAALATLSTPATQLHANTTKLNAPGDAGRPTNDATTSMRAELRVTRGLGDCSNTVAASPTSYTSTAVNVTYVAGLSASAATPYPGAFAIQINNLGASNDVVAYYNLTSTAITTTTCPAGLRIKAGYSDTLWVSSRAGGTLHLQGVSGTGSVAYTICNE